VIDSRLGKDNSVIRRRRECLNCKKRFTTYERIEEILPYVIKKDGRREAFDRRKIVEGMVRACEKRPVSIDRIEAVADAIEQELMERSEKEIKVAYVGERVMKELREMDDVAYVRFASVYRSFRDIEEFMNELKELYELKKAGSNDNLRAEPRRTTQQWIPVKRNGLWHGASARAMGVGRTANPVVGAVLVKDGKVVGKGITVPQVNRMRSGGHCSAGSGAREPL
jgi:transcriptional repressor NrdR